MIKNFIITGDCHGGREVVARLNNINQNSPELVPSETAIIILGDSGLNFWLNKTDEKYKKMLGTYDYTIYCLRGNHEERPENISTMVRVWDEQTTENVYIEREYPNIKYLIDGGNYQFGGYKCLALGGAYSVDKYWRLQHLPEAWFKDEQLSQEEMDNIWKYIKHESYDFILSHTCPYSFRPTDLFLNFIDQNSVDTSMERWLEQVKDTVDWGVWCFGHYHADRVERPYVEQFYTSWEDIDDIWKRWQSWRQGTCKELPYWLDQGPNWNWEEE